MSETATTPPENAQDQRDAQGRFKVGNGGGPGNPFARQVAALRKALLAAVTPDDIAAILQALLDQAKKGNVQAAKLVLSYTVGKPERVADPDRIDAHEWALQKETAGMMQELSQVTQAPDPEVPLRAARVFRSLVGSIVEKQLLDAWMNPPPAPEIPELVMGRGYEPPIPNGLLDMLAQGQPKNPGSNGQPHGPEEVWVSRLAGAEPLTNGGSRKKKSGKRNDEQRTENREPRMNGRTGG